MKLNLTSLALAALAFLAAAPAALRADPLPGEIPKFNQQPELATSILDVNGVANTYNGHDELSTAYAVTNTAGVQTGYSGTFAADDFADTFNTPVVHISWWGSYLPSSVNPTPHTQKFLISFESDVPGIPGTTSPFSHPGAVLSSQVVTLGALAPASGTYTEAQVAATSVDGPTFKYNAELANPFPEVANTVYWLKIVALDDGVPTISNPTGAPIQWGWHNRDFTQPDPLASISPNVIPGEGPVGFLPDGITPINHFQDDAVSGVINDDFLSGIRESNFAPLDYLNNIDGPAGSNAAWPGIGNYSEDLAFELYTQNAVPEPASLFLLAIGAPLLLKRRK